MVTCEHERSRNRGRLGTFEGRSRVRIAVIGPGKIGATVATGLARAGHTVAIAGSRSPAELEALARTLGVAESGSVTHCVERSDVVVVSIPFGRHVSLPAAPFTGRVVIDAMNYWVSRDGADQRLESGDVTSSELLQAYLSEAKVVKGLNTMKWETLRDGGRRKGDPKRLIIPLSGDDSGAVCDAAELVDDLGFDSVNVGPLRTGGLLQQPEGRLHGILVTSSGWSDLFSTKINE